MKRWTQTVRNVPQHWVGDGFPVRSLFSYLEGEKFDPFLLLDYAAPQAFPPATKKRGVGEHPHRGFETVTIAYSGEIEHRDSAGGGGRIGPGDVQWMTAASGLVHEEFHGGAFTQAGGTLEMVQLWVNLPKKDKMSSPKYQGITDASIPKVALEGERGTVRVIAGNFRGTKGPASTFTPIDLWDVAVKTEGAIILPVPEGYTTMLVVQRGTVVNHEGQAADAGDLVIFERKGENVRFSPSAGARFLFLGGKPIGEPVVGQGPFVMNTRDEIRQAIADYQSGKMGKLTSGN